MKKFQRNSKSQPESAFWKAWLCGFIVETQISMCKQCTALFTSTIAGTETPSSMMIPLSQ